MITLYSTHCPRCKVIMKKLEAKGLEYEEVTSIEQMKALGISAVNKVLPFLLLTVFCQFNSQVP